MFYRSIQPTIEPSLKYKIGDTVNAFNTTEPFFSSLWSQMLTLTSLLHCLLRRFQLSDMIQKPVRLALLSNPNFSLLDRLYRGRRLALEPLQRILGKYDVRTQRLKTPQSGLSAEQTLQRLIADDPGRATRQIGIVDAAGNVANYTGDECNAWAGAVSGNTGTAQGNILAGEDVVKAMGKAFEETEGELADKLMAALFAGQEAGGDTRGQQSAALFIVQENGGYGGFNDRYIDLRVDDAEKPIEELQRLLEIHKKLVPR